MKQGIIDIWEILHIHTGSSHPARIKKCPVLINVLDSIIWLTLHLRFVSTFFNEDNDDPDGDDNITINIKKIEMSRLFTVFNTIQNVQQPFL